MANYLLDSNILIHIVRGTSLAEHVKQKYQPLLSDPMAAISVNNSGRKNKGSQKPQAL